jgi:hypothetical protein
MGCRQILSAVSDIISEVALAVKAALRVICGQSPPKKGVTVRTLVTSLARPTGAEKTGLRCAFRPTYGVQNGEIPGLRPTALSFNQLSNSHKKGEILTSDGVELYCARAR